MIEHLTDADVSEVAKRLVMIRATAGAGALGRVLTLVAVCDPGHEDAIASVAIETAREHPMRIIVLSADERAADRLDAEIRVGEDARASDVVILRTGGEVGSDQASLVTGLLLADAPIVVWWCDSAPVAPVSTPLGRIATRRITDVAAVGGAAELQALIGGHAPGDTDLSWARLTPWRALLAAELDEPPYVVPVGATVSGLPDSAPAVLLAAWLRHALGVPVELASDPEATRRQPLCAVELRLPSGPIELRLDADHNRLRLSHPQQPDHEVVPPARGLADCLSEELRGLSADPVYSETLTCGVPTLFRERA